MDSERTHAIHNQPSCHGPEAVHPWLTRGDFFSPNTYAELMAYERGAGRGGSGGLPLPVLALLACAAACFWPVTGLFTLLGAALAVSGVENAGADHGGMLRLASFFVGGGAGLYIGLKIERVVSGQPSTAWRGTYCG